MQARTAALRVSEARFQAFMEHIPAATWIADADGRLQYHNAAYPGLFQHPTLGALDQPGVELVLETPPALPHEAAKMTGGWKIGPVTARARRPDGSEGSFLVQTFPLPSTASPGLFGGVALDVTERVQATQVLAEREERFRVLVQHASDLIVVLNADGVVIDVTPPASATLTGLPHGVRSPWCSPKARTSTIICSCNAPVCSLMASPISCKLQPFCCILQPMLLLSIAL